MNKVVDELLKQYPFIGDDIRREQAELNRYIELKEQLKDMSTIVYSNPLHAQCLDGLPHGTDTGDPTGNLAIKNSIGYIKLRDKYQDKINEQVAKINELIDRQKWLDKAYASLTPEERAVVCLLYNEQYSERRVAKMMYKGSRYKLVKVANEAKHKIKGII